MKYQELSLDANRRHCIIFLGLGNLEPCSSSRSARVHSTHILNDRSTFQTLSTRSDIKLTASLHRNLYSHVFALWNSPVVVSQGASGRLIFSFHLALLLHLKHIALEFSGVSFNPSLILAIQN